MHRVLVLVAFLGCSKPSPSSPPPTGSGAGSATTTTTPPPANDTCSPAALGHPGATTLAAWTPPAGCKVEQSNSPRVLSTEADIRAALDCADAKAPLGLDVATQVLIVTSTSWSPAQVGLDAIDDGTRVFFVSRQRPPCPDDPHPMPTPPITSAFLAKPGARTFDQTSCTVARTCP